MTVGGQAKVLNAQEWSRLEKVGQSITHRTIWAILRFTGCRSQEARLLNVDNVYVDPVERITRDCIFFPANIRKGKKWAISVPINSKLKSYLKCYPVPESGFLFPSPRDPQKAISYEAIYKYLKQSAAACGLGHEKIGTHCGRRSLITHLAQQGVNPRLIQTISGHRSLNTLQRYIEVSDGQKIEALENLSL
jgi:integrase/recombinase XerD